jgi:replicative DNA helicase
MSDFLIPPSSPELEKAILGTALLYPNFLNDGFMKLAEEDFYVTANRKIFSEIRNLHISGSAVDVMILAETLKGSGELESLGGTPALSELCESGYAGSKSHVAKLKELSTRRQLITLCREYQSAAYDEDPDEERTTADILAEFQTKIMKLSRGFNIKGPERIGAVMPRAFDEIEAYARREFHGLNTGIAKIDEITGGLHRGELTIVAGRPSMGKTSFAECVATNFVKNKIPVLFFSQEMSSTQLAIRTICRESGVPVSSVRTGTVANRDMPKMSIAAGPISDYDLWLDETSSVRGTDVSSRARTLIQSGVALGLIIIDYLQLMTGDRSKGQNREQEISGISRMLKQVAKDLSLPVIAVSQLSRAVEQRGGDKRPQLSDLRDSGGIEQDADAVMFCYRPKYYFPEKPEYEGIAEIGIAKQRNGPTGWVKCFFDEKLMAFKNLETINDWDNESPQDGRNA